MRHRILAVLLGLAGCQAVQSPPAAAPESPDEQRARAICRDSVSRDIAYGSGVEDYIRNCMQLRLREIRAGKR